MEETTTLLRIHEDVYAGGAGTLSHQRDVIYISIEIGDVIAHPAQRQYLIFDACIAGHLQLTILQAQEAQGTHSVVEGHQQNIVLHEIVRPIDVSRGATYLKASAIDPHHDR